MTDQEVREDLKKAFDLFDKDEDGLIDPATFTRLIIFLGLQVERLNTADFLVTPDEITREMFIQMVMAKLTSATADNLTVSEIVTAFRRFDVDDTGTITNEKLGNLLRALDTDTQPLKEEEIAALIEDFDDEGKGELNYEDLVDVMMYRMGRADMELNEIENESEINAKEKRGIEIETGPNNKIKDEHDQNQEKDENNQNKGKGGYDQNKGEDEKDQNKGGDNNDQNKGGNN